MPQALSQPFDAVAGLLETYRPLPGVPDELIGPDGRPRPVWRPFLEHLAALKPGEVADNLKVGDQYLRDAGVFYRQYGQVEKAEREWPLSHVPVMIPEAEWRRLEAGLVQRADLLEAIIADLYGPADLVRDGHIPAGLVAASPQWLRPMVGVTPRGGRYLHFVAFELGRGPDGAWWVLADRTEAPSGAGFALENRVAAARSFAKLYSQSNVLRVAEFFRDFRDTLLGELAGGDGRVGILTPGIHNDTYFEHAYIARYLGFPLLEGGDLVVEDDRLMVRTVDGRTPVAVLWRRLDSAFADPLELDETSRLGTPGLVDALRAGRLSMVNALGAGVLEMRALLAFMPRLSLVLRGEPLAIPNVATWWCGGEAERAHVLRHHTRITLGRALSTRPFFEIDGGSELPGGEEPAARRARLFEALARDGAGFAGQEAVSLSTTPVWTGRRLEPRPMSLRVFLARTANGWQAMPGGFARLGASQDPSAIAMQRGGMVADVWVHAERPVEIVTMLSAAQARDTRRQASGLPSRSADNLFWLGRYVERVDVMLRLLRAYHVRMAEAAGSSTPLQALIADHLKEMEVDVKDAIPAGLLRTIDSARGSAGGVRDRFSTDAWAALEDLSKTARELAKRVKPGDDNARAVTVLLRKIAGFAGLVHENMYRSVGWRFLSIGRLLERGASMCDSIARFADVSAPTGGADLVVELGDSVMSHRRRYSVATNRGTVVELLALDTRNPRAILSCLGELRDHVDHLPRHDEEQRLTALSRAALRLETELATASPAKVDTAFIRDVEAGLYRVSDLLIEQYLS